MSRGPRREPSGGAGYMASAGTPHNGEPSQGQRGWAVLAHLGIVLLLFALPFPFVTGLLLVLVLRLTVGRTPGFLRENIDRAFNFQLLVVVLVVVLVMIAGATDGAEDILGGLFLVVILGGVGLAVYAAIQAYHGRTYRYPVSLPVMR